MLANPINVASVEFGVIILAVMAARQLIGVRALPYALGLAGMWVAASWLDAKTAAVLFAALAPHYVITRALWGAPHRSSKMMLAAAISWQVLILASTKITGFSESWGIYGVVGLSYITFRQIHLLIEAPRAKGAFRSVYWLSYLINPLTLVAGPIQTWEQHVNQLSDDRSNTKDNFISATHLITKGLIKITILAPIFAGQGDFSALANSNANHVDWIVAYYAYYIFLFLDFSGYIDVVLGCGALCGYTLPSNFNRPYLAANFQDFWGRWHITLGVWFRTHVFLPMLTSLQRRNVFSNPDHAIVCALIVVFLLIGVWHGIAWHFLLFGIIHALGVSLSHILRQRQIKRKKKGEFMELTGVQGAAYKALKIVVFQNIVAGTFILLDNDISAIWSAIFHG